jgi:hypothetical protein
MYNRVSAPNANKFGFGLCLNQYISKSLQGNISYRHRAVYKTIEAGLEWFHNIFHGTRALSLSLSASHSSSDNVPHDNSLTFGLQYYFMPITQTYHIPDFSMNTFKTWVSKPVVHMAQVLAAADQKSVQASIFPVASNVFSFQEIDNKLEGTIAEQMRWNVNTNIPQAQLEYHLTILKVSQHSSSINILKDTPIVSDKVLYESAYLDRDVRPNQTYKVILHVVEKKTGLSKTYTGSFSTNDDMMTWPKALNPTFTNTYTDKDRTIGGLLSFNTAQSSLASNMHYNITLQPALNNKPSFSYNDYSADDIKKGVSVKGLIPGITYHVIVEPYDDYNIKGPIAKGDIQSSKAGTITWLSNDSKFTSNEYDPAKGTIYWHVAIPSFGTSSDMNYTVDVTGGNRLPTISHYTCSGNICSASISNLERNTDYTSTITATDISDNPASQTVRFHTNTLGKFIWHNVSPQVSNDHQTLSWNAAMPSSNATVTYTLTVSYQDDNGQFHTFAGGAVSTTDTHYRFANNVFLPGVSYSVTITANDDCDSNTTQSAVNV